LLHHWLHIWSIFPWRPSTTLCHDYFFFASCNSSTCRITVCRQFKLTLLKKNFFVTWRLDFSINFCCVVIWCKAVITHKPTWINLFDSKYTSHVEENVFFYMHHFFLDNTYMFLCAPSVKWKDSLI